MPTMTFANCKALFVTTFAKFRWVPLVLSSTYESVNSNR